MDLDLRQHRYAAPLLLGLAAALTVAAAPEASEGCGSSPIFSDVMAS